MKKLEYWHNYLPHLDWRWLFGGGLAVGLGIGLTGFPALESPWWLLFWGALFIALAWLGWDAAPRLANPLIPPREKKRPMPRIVRDGDLEMVELPGGEFLMGSPDGYDMARDNEKPRHQVSVSGFRIDRTPITAGLYRAVMEGGDPAQGKDHPVTAIDWYQALEFCNRLSRRHRYRPCYRKRGLWRWRRWQCDWKANGYRLPTEAEWEYACRAGTQTHWSFGDDQGMIGDYAWHAGNSGDQTQPVGRKRPNPWGLYDMHGNVWEWVGDWYGTYPAETQTDPKGPATGKWRVVRGGSFWDQPERLRSARRVDGRPEFRDGNGGFRCVRVPARQH